MYYSKLVLHVFGSREQIVGTLMAKLLVIVTLRVFAADISAPF